MPAYNDATRAYITELFALQDDALRHIYNAPTDHDLPNISITPEEGHFLQLLVRLSGARKAVEIGALGGYSGTWIARGLADGGRLISLEKSARHAEIVRANFALAGVADRTEVRVGDARQLLGALGSEGPFDFVFADADKDSAVAYFDWAVENLRVGGVFTSHNALAHGGVAETDNNADNVVNMRALNARAAAEPRVHASIYPAGDGMLVAVRLA